jgi:hypothetical protein
MDRLAGLVIVAAKHNSLVMGISHPRDCANGSDTDGDGCYRPNDEN